MSQKETDPVKRLTPGFYAFASKGKICELEIIDHPGKRLGVQVLFSVSRLGPNEEKEIVVPERGNIAEEMVDALRRLGEENFSIISDFARKKAEREDRAMQRLLTVSFQESARKKLARTGKIPGEYVLFKSDRF